MVLPHLQMIQSHLYYFYTNGQSKTRYCRHFSGRYCFALSFQASISFPQVQAVSAANIMSLIHAGRGRRLEELPQFNYPTLLHIYVGIKM